MSGEEQEQSNVTSHMSRRRRSRGRKQTEKEAHSFPWAVMLWGLLLVLTVVMLLNPWRWFVVNDPQMLFGAGRSLYWLAYEGGSGILGLLLGLVTAVWGFFLLRDRINDNKGLYATACPHCGSPALKRARRTTLDRLWGALGIPVRRYICAVCKWQGPRIDQTRLWK
jgi:DNA-directed RNA polymerase subunit RPC12/RpoP